jgi:hypothetical protein
VDGFFHFLAALALCATILIVAAMALFVVVMRMGPNPLKDVLTGLLRRLAATAGVAIVGVPLQPVPVADGIYDLAGIIVLTIYWIGFFRETLATVRGGKSDAARRAPKVVEPLNINPPKKR